MENQIPTWIQAMQGFDAQGMVQVMLAAVLGGLIGWERERSGRDAGFRTNILIATGACLFTILSIRGFPLNGSASQDTARVAAQIVSGVGFLGAGVMFRTKHHTKGLTTAATIWMVAAIGMTVGVQAYSLAVFTAVFTFVILHFLRPVSKTITPNGRKKQPPPTN